MSLTQPWAELVARGEKRIETRSRWTSYRGDLAIQASKGFPGSCKRLCMEEPFASVLEGRIFELPLGMVVAVVEVVECFQFDDETDRLLRHHPDHVARHYSKGLRPAQHEADLGDYSKGRYGYVMTNLRRLREPVPVKGMLGIFTLPDDAALAVERQLTSMVSGEASDLFQKETKEERK